VFHQNLHAESQDPNTDALAGIIECAAWFNRYLDEREQNPQDDVMTQLLHMELVDESGQSRPLRRDEILTYLTLIASAGSDTTALALGWAIKALGENPDQLQRLREERALLQTAVEEAIRYEAVSYHATRFVSTDVEIHGQTVPAGSTMVVLPPAANRDERQFNDPDAFDVSRPAGQQSAFGFGPHFCLGASLARLEVRVALDVLLDTVPTWSVDPDRSTLVPGINTRGWESLAVTF
jgi:cytochrome P450